MSRYSTGKNLLVAFAIAVLLSFLMPADVLAKGRGQRNGRWRNDNWKCGRFVNCHDARDGRWDGRGPRRNFSRYDRRDNDWRWRSINNNRRNTRWRDNDWRNNNWRDRRTNQWRDSRWRDNSRWRYARRTNRWR